MNIELKPPFFVEFDDAGGYDGMTAAYKIKDQRPDEMPVITVDVRDFVGPTCTVEECESENTLAKEVADVICAALNERWK